MSKLIKVPKSIAGVKIPKTVRKGPLGHFLNSPAAQLLIAEAVIGAVAALSMRRTESGERAGAVLGRRVASFGMDTGESVRQGSERLARALRAAIDAFRDSLQGSQRMSAAFDEPSMQADDEDLLERKSITPGSRRGAARH